MSVLRPTLMPRRMNNAYITTVPLVLTTCARRCVRFGKGQMLKIRKNAGENCGLRRPVADAGREIA